MTDQISPSQHQTDALMTKIEQTMHEPLSEAQRRDLEQVLLQAKSTDHAIDLHGDLPLHFIRLYFVFQLGRDKRSKKVPQEIVDLRKSPSFFAKTISIVVALWPVYLMIGGIYYFLMALPH